MGVRRQWKILKLANIEMDGNTRAKLIEAITRKKNIQVTLYAWDIDSIHQIAQEAFFTEQAAMKNWLLQKRIWEMVSAPTGIPLYSWKISADDIMEHIHDMKLRNVPMPLTTEMSVGIVPSSLYEDLQRSLKKQP